MELMAEADPFVHDTAADRQAEHLAQQLREMQSLLHMAAQMGRLGAWAYDVDRPCVTWSGEVCAIHEVPPGYSPTPEETIDFFAPEYRDHVAEVLSACLADGTPFDVEGEIITARGKRVYIRAIGEAEWDERGIVRRLQGAIQDISEVKSAAERELRMAEEHAALLERRVGERTAQLELANKELEAFSYSIAHDLRAPLGSIDGFSKMLRQAAGDALPERCGHYLARIQAGVQQMAQLTDGLLALSSLSRTDLRAEAVDLAVLARSALDGCQQQDGDRRVEALVFDTLPAWGDPRLLSIAMANLVGNAWKFTSKAQPARIEVGAVADHAHEQVVYFVRDNGAGFDMAYASRLFEPFHRLHAAGDFGGTGIGLAIAHKVITRHGGRIWAESAPERGATFLFTLPQG